MNGSEDKPVGYTNEAQLSYVEQGEDGLFYPDTDHDCNVRLYRSPQRQLSPLERDGLPSFYASTEGLPPCTHRISEKDIPVWCRTIDDASALMDMLITQQAESQPK